MIPFGLRTLIRNPIQERAEIMYPVRCPKCGARGRDQSDLWHMPPCVPYVRRRKP